MGAQVMHPTTRAALRTAALLWLLLLALLLAACGGSTQDDLPAEDDGRTSIPAPPACNTHPGVCA